MRRRSVDKVERVARALAMHEAYSADIDQSDSAQWEPPKKSDFDDCLTPEEQEEWRAIARVAIEAMREGVHWYAQFKADTKPVTVNGEVYNEVFNISDVEIVVDSTLKPGEWRLVQMPKKPEQLRSEFLADLKPRMVEILEHAVAPGTVIDREQLHRDVNAEILAFRAERRAVRGEPCKVALFSDDVCTYGTKGCFLKHSTHPRAELNYRGIFDDARAAREAPSIPALIERIKRELCSDMPHASAVTLLRQALLALQAEHSVD